MQQHILGKQNQKWENDDIFLKLGDTLEAWIVLVQDSTSKYKAEPLVAVLWWHSNKWVLKW
jgi:hypothetical protein